MPDASLPGNAQKMNQKRQKLEEGAVKKEKKKAAGYV